MFARLGAYYFLFFAAVGVFIPYWPPYLQARGLSPEAIGSLLGLASATRVVVPNLWGWLADRRGRPMAVVRLAGGLAALAVAVLVLLPDSVAVLAAVTVAYVVFSAGTLSQFEATTFAHLGRDGARYGRIRLWGSVGFIVAVSGFAPLLERLGSGVTPLLLGVLLAALWLLSLAVADGPVQRHDAEGGGLGSVLRRREVQALLAVSCLVQVAHGPYYTFYSIHLAANGYGREAVGALWSLGVLAEIGVFVVMPRLWARFGPRRLLLAALLLSALRWTLVGLAAAQLGAVLLAQLLHAASFGICHAVAVQLVQRWFGPRHQGRGQALYASMSGGLGGGLGAWLSGQVWPAFGPAATFLVGAAVFLLAFAVALLAVREPAGAPA